MQVKALRNNYSITTAGLSRIEDDAIGFLKLDKVYDAPLFKFHLGFPKFFRIPFSICNMVLFGLSGKSNTYSRNDLKKLSSTNYNLIICHHPETIELGLKLKRKFGCKLIFNAHEIYPLEFDNDEVWMFRNHKRLDTILRNGLPYFDCVLTVSDEINNWYRERYACKILTVHNSKPYYAITSHQLSKPIRVIHHGGAMPQRNLEQMAEAVLACNGRYELTFMLMETDPRYYKVLREKYEPKGVKFVPPVNYNDIIPTISSYDIGLYILPNDTINHDLALPNKVFEFLQARLAIITSPNKGLKKFVLENGIGLVSDGFESMDMAKLLMSLDSDQIQKLKQTSNEVAVRLSSENDESIILEAVKSVLDH